MSDNEVYLWSNKNRCNCFQLQPWMSHKKRVPWFTCHISSRSVGQILIEFHVCVFLHTFLMYPIPLSVPSVAFPVWWPLFWPALYMNRASVTSTIFRARFFWLPYWILPHTWHVHNMSSLYCQSTRKSTQQNAVLHGHYYQGERHQKVSNSKARW